MQPFPIFGILLVHQPAAAAEAEWRWAELGICLVWLWRAAELVSAELFGHPRVGDFFKAAHLALVQGFLGYGTCGYSRLWHEGFITRHTTGLEPGQLLIDRTGKCVRILSSTGMHGAHWLNVLWEADHRKLS